MLLNVTAYQSVLSSGVKLPISTARAGDWGGQEVKQACWGHLKCRREIESGRGIEQSAALQCMSPETKLKLLRQRMSGMGESVAELRRREMEYMSLVRIQARLWHSHAPWRPAEAARE